MKRLLKSLGVILVLVAAVWGYIHRKPVFYHLSSFASVKTTRLSKATYAKGYSEAKDAPGSDRLLFRAKMHWDLWCVAMSAEIQKPKEKDGMVFYRVIATDRTDTECIYVFAPDGRLLEIAFLPLA
jgi:hypothetical protein